MRRPIWWSWELLFTPHILKRMTERDFTEADVRAMLNSATSVRRDLEADRWVARSPWRRGRWEIILEPDLSVRVTVVVTAYPIDA